MTRRTTRCLDPVSGTTWSPSPSVTTLQPCDPLAQAAKQISPLTILGIPQQVHPDSGVCENKWLRHHLEIPNNEEFCMQVFLAQPWSHRTKYTKKI